MKTGVSGEFPPRKRMAAGLFALLTALCAVVVACALVLSSNAAFAIADDGSGQDPSDPAAANAPEGEASDVDEAASAANTVILKAQEETIADEAVSVSADGESATIDKSPFALEGFFRAQVGSNRTADDGSYVGYSYYVSNEPGHVAVIAAYTHVIVYVSDEATAKVGFDRSSPEDQAYLQRLLIALDEQNAKGGAALSTEVDWYFVGSSVFELDGVAYRFDQELKDGQFFAVVVGADGSDVTDPTSQSYVNLVHSDYGVLVSAESVEVMAAPTGIEAMVSFLQNIDYSPLWVTLKTTGTAIVFIFILGLAAAYFSLRIPARAQDIADSIFTIPMVLPPTVCGFLLLLAFGRNTGIGQWFIDIGFPLVFSWQATVIAAVVVAFPLMYRSARGAFEGLDPNMLDAARTLGWSNAKIFFKLMLPLSWSSVAAGTVLAFARALGEFGATLFLAGNYLGITRTIPIAIYFEWMNGNTDAAIFWTIIILIFSFIVILFINLWSRRTNKYRKGVSQ